MTHFQMNQYFIFLIIEQNVDCGYLLEPPHLGGSNKHQQSCIETDIKSSVILSFNGPKIITGLMYFTEIDKRHTELHGV